MRYAIETRYSETTQRLSKRRRISLCVSHIEQIKQCSLTNAFYIVPDVYPQFLTKVKRVFITLGYSYTILFGTTHYIIYIRLVT